MVNALLHHVRDLSGVGGRLRPGIVHRLDRDTSGLLVVAKSDQAHLALSDALRQRKIRRIYTTLVWGHLSEDSLTIDAPIGRDPEEPQADGRGPRRAARGDPRTGRGAVAARRPARRGAQDRANPPDPRPPRPHRTSGGRRLRVRGGVGARDGRAEAGAGPTTSPGGSDASSCTPPRSDSITR